MPAEEPNHEPTPHGLNGWWYVLIFLVPALYLQGIGLGSDGRAEPAEAGPLLAADCAIGLRAVLGLVAGRSTRWWAVYCALYAALPAIATQAMRWLN